RRDCVVLHGGATAVFRVPSLGAAAQLAEAVAQVPGLELDVAKALRHAMHVDVSVAREQVEARVAAALAQEAASSTTPMPLRPGSSPTAPATACASLSGPTGPFRPPG